MSTLMTQIPRQLKQKLRHTVNQLLHLEITCMYYKKTKNSEDSGNGESFIIYRMLIKSLFEYILAVLTYYLIYSFGWSKYRHGGSTYMTAWGSSKVQTVHPHEVPKTTKKVYLYTNNICGKEKIRENVAYTEMTRKGNIMVVWTATNIAVQF